MNDHKAAEKTAQRYVYESSIVVQPDLHVVNLSNCYLEKIGFENNYHGLDTPDRVCFYEQEFYPLSNFSAFNIMWKDFRFDTSEAVYHWEKFPWSFEIQALIVNAKSAHEAFKIAQMHKSERRPDWDLVKVAIMREILWAKVSQHEYVRKKLLETGKRELVENSWRDDFWGWGPDRNGQNQLGKLWMEIREAIWKVDGIQY